MNDNAVLDKSSGSVPVPGNATSPVGSMNKEAPAINLDLGSSELTPAEPETQHDIDQELTDLEVKEVKDNPDLTSEHKELGVKASGPYVPIPPPSDNVILSMSEEEIKAKSKTVKSDDSEKWYMTLLKKIIGWERFKDK
jgi:hypothetical protein